MNFLCPGKAMLAGEYAVLGHSGVATAVAITSPRLHLEARPAERWRVESPPDDPFALAALAAAGPKAAPQTLRLWQEPAATGKVGAGMSAAACALVAAAVFASEGRDIRAPATRSRLLAAALRAHRHAQGGRGSGYDVATVIHGGLVVTRTEEDGAVSVHRRHLPAGLVLARLPSELHAGTPSLIDRMRDVDPGPLRAAAEAVAAVATARELLGALEEAQRAFERWDHHHGLGLIPPPLESIVRRIREAGFVARISGAGGGDSVLAVTEDAEALHRAVTRWRAEGIPAERLQVDEEGLRATPAD